MHGSAWDEILYMLYILVPQLESAVDYIYHNLRLVSYTAVILATLLEPVPEYVDNFMYGSCRSVDTNLKVNI